MVSREQLIDFRRQLHRYPEVAGEEAKTAERIRAFLTEHAPPDELITGLGGHGLLAGYAFGTERPQILIRCELDALPIEEANAFSHRSAFPGKSHKCGHDGHMTIVAGLAARLPTLNLQRGRILLLFQPAEETGAGARAVLEDPRFQEISPDYVFALHNMPGAPMHQIIRVERQFSATVKSAIIRLQGQQSHAAEPENGRNPAWAMAEIAQFLRSRIIPDPRRADFTLITPVFTRMGQPDYGISAGYGELHYTLRTWSVAGMDTLTQQLEAAVTSIAHAHGLTADFSYVDYFPATRNDAAANQLIERAARSAGLDLVKQEVPNKFGEDFGWLAQRFPGAMFGLGAGRDTPVLHNDHYDFPDALIESGIAIFQQLITEVLAP